MMFDPLTTNATDLVRLLEDGKVNSVQVVLAYLSQIERYEPKLHAFISVAPREQLIAIASARDEERQQGHTRGPLHGVPIVLKDITIHDSF